MKIYKVGGAVRDKLLNYPFTDEDWVVVGAKSKELIDQGFTQVGSEFPVFLHPKSKDEYSLARTERKSGLGYKGFEFFTDSDVTLEADLSRRDITINAMAENTNGEVIDPYGGKNDLSKKILRHVSEAFIEDPLRVLRVARFAARYHHLGFKIADETMLLMTLISDSGELKYLSAERVWTETEKALKEGSPSIFIKVLYECKALSKLFPEIDRLFSLSIPDSDTNVGDRTLSSLDYAAKLDPDASVRFAVLVSDINLKDKNNLAITSNIPKIDLDNQIFNDLFSRLKIPNRYQEIAIAFIKYRNFCRYYKDCKPQDILNMLDGIGAFKKAENLEKFIYCCQAGEKLTGNIVHKAYQPGIWLKNVFNKINAIDNKKLISRGYEGVKLGQQIDICRRKIIADSLN
ncbi:MAG: multifunctional CCA addition/repair protein [Porticoccus sp.]|jgi:tRNA nucleotidyltransferase (CCA-adding enzyme)|nr:multifunctional CCA addition/repair protein [Porticoccus sp.]